MKTYTGGCHCGNVRFEVALDLQGALSCNCSFCSKRGGLLAFAPASAFTLLQGEDSLTEYQFNKKIIHHLFCKVCGIAPFGRGTDQSGNATVAINIRCLDDIDIDTLPVTHYNGKNV